MTTQSRPYVKSSRSGGSGGNCVEWAFTAEGVYVRDSKHPDGPELRVTYQEWAAIIEKARRGEILMEITHKGHSLHFTPGEWKAFLEAINLGECLPTPTVAGRR